MLSNDTITFDIGGTWFRSALILKEGTFIDYQRDPSLNFQAHPQLTVDQLQHALINYILQRTAEICKNHPDKTIESVSIGIGAPVNANSELVLNSGPLWGPTSKPLDLKKMLTQKAPNIGWHIVNDLSAEISFYANQSSQESGKLSLITISTGAGMRTFDFDNRTIPVDNEFGIQGEIGHIPISFFIKDQPIHATCDCGGKDHFNAFCSGRGIKRMLPLFTKAFEHAYQQSSIYAQIKNETNSLDFIHLIKLLEHGDEFGFILLKQITRPLAEIIIYHLTFSPEVHTLVLTGGVTHSLHPYYLNALLSNLEEMGLYQISDPDYFRKRITVSADNHQTNLLGAALYCNRLYHYPLKST